jgi:ATP-dependent Clp endopeptidase proteolytic subunit ClpP
MAASMGAILLVGGAPGKRFALPNATVMLHQASGGFEGTATDIEIRAREILRLQNRIREIVQFHTGQPLDRIARDSDRDFFMTPEQALDYGIIDQIIGRSKAGSPGANTDDGNVVPAAEAAPSAASSNQSAGASGQS